MTLKTLENQGISMKHIQVPQISDRGQLMQKSTEDLVDLVLLLQDFILHRQKNL